MLTQTQYYQMYLEDYRFPRTSANVRPYYGTMEDFLGLTTRMAEQDGPKVRYADTIDALESYHMDHNITHWIAGHNLPLLTPVEDLCRYDITLKNQQWEYHCYNGSIYKLRAQEVRVSQILFRKPDGLERCLKASFTGLQVSVPKIGWFFPDISIQGFPGIVTWENDIHTVHLLTSQQLYHPDALEQAKTDMVYPGKISLSHAVGDILGEM